MIRMLYFSTAATDMSREAVQGIVAHAATKNARLGVTGALAYNGRNFCQLLEGKEEVVRALVQTIREDPRHAGFKVIDEKPITKRHFPDWSMRLVNDLDFSIVINAMKE
ncbi:MAG: BLUF domain-containing protein [Pseudomonadota bacterium]